MNADPFQGPVRKVMVVGSWAKEQITIENLRRKQELSVFAYMDTHNPGIVAMADEFEIGSLVDIDKVVAFAQRSGADLVLPTVAAPLAAGLVDALEARGITAFGPRRAAARLESDKAFTRGLVETRCPEATPAYRVLETVDEAVEFARALEWQVAVKPLGLMDGLGVRVWGEQLTREDQVVEFIKQIIENEMGGCPRVLIEERLEGEEFTLQCLVDGRRCVPTPAVQDFKKLLSGERGPNTASMGSYSSTGPLLPFLNQDDYDLSLEIMRRTLDSLDGELDQPCRGFLSGQFMITRSGLKLIEYNFRPGDPEWINTAMVLEDNLVDLITELMAGGEPAARCAPKATVCKYVVPPGYPERTGQILDLELDAKQIRQAGVRWYYSCGEDEHGRLNVGSERGIAFVAADHSIAAAHERVEDAIATLEGSFRHRDDIGAPELIQEKKDAVVEIISDRLEFRRVQEEEFPAVHEFVTRCPGLEPYPLHLYRIVHRFFGDTCFVALDGDKLVGFAMGFFSQVHPGTFFLWEIGVSPSRQGQGLGTRLLEYVERQVITHGAQRIQVTIHPDNTPSRKVFEKKGFINISDGEAAAIDVAGEPAARDFYGPGRHFMVYEKIYSEDAE